MYKEKMNQLLLNFLINNEDENKTVGEIAKKVVHEVKKDLLKSPPISMVVNKMRGKDWIIGRLNIPTSLKTSKDLIVYVGLPKDFLLGVNDPMALNIARLRLQEKLKKNIEEVEAEEKKVKKTKKKVTA